MSSMSLASHLKMNNFRLKVTTKDRGIRLDQYIIKSLKLPISRTRIQHLINIGHVTVNRKLCKSHYQVKEDDVLWIKIPPPAPTRILPEQIPLEIVFEDDDILIVNKLAGMVTHPAHGHYSRTLVNALLHYGCPLSTINGPLRPGIVHRLDKDTSGLIVIAKNDFAHQDLAGQFQRHTVKRQYVAIVKGMVEHSEGVIDLPIARHPHNPQKMTVSFLKGTRPALTRYKVLRRYRRVTFLELTPHTGRTHQLRVHLKHSGHQILGDARYGSVSTFTRLALHATVLGFRHPRTKKFVEFKINLPESFRTFLNSLQ